VSKIENSSRKLWTGYTEKEAREKIEPLEEEVAQFFFEEDGQVFDSDWILFPHPFRDRGRHSPTARDSGARL
jgi:hypothetical protein